MSKESKELPPSIMRRLQAIRKANWGIRGCVNVLREDRTNGDCVPTKPCVFLRLESMDAGDLMHAVEACSSLIEQHMDEMEIEVAEHYAQKIDKEMQDDLERVERICEEAREADEPGNLKIVH